MTAHDDAQTVGVVDDQYAYDGDGKRVKKTNGSVTTIFVYDIQGQMVAEYTDYTSSQTTGTSYFTSDHLGTPRIITNNQGVVISRHDYLPFGEEISAGTGGRSVQQGYVIDGVRQKFTGKERDDETGLDYFSARYYSSTQGRFTSADPVTLTSARLFDPQRINLYAYVRNNPLKFIDPDGEDIYLNNDTRNGRRKALLSITANMRASEAKNVGVRWNKDAGKYEVYLKDSSHSSKKARA
jgi:RHS repeat-associated protein